MLIYKGTKEEILHPLQKICGVAERKNTLPITTHVLFETLDDKLQLVTTDLEIQIKTLIPYQNLGEKISVTVAVQKLVEVLRSLDNLAKVELIHDNNRVVIKCGKSKFSLQSLNGENFPLLSISNQTCSPFKIKQVELKKLIKKTHYAIALKEVRYYLNGLLFKIEENNLITVASDGHRLAYSSTQLEGIYPEIEHIIPRKTISELNSLLSDNPEDTIEITPCENQLIFNFNNIELISKIIDGRYPDYNRIIPIDIPNYIIVNTQLMINCLTRIYILTSELERTILVKLNGDILSIVVENIKNEDAYEEIAITRNSEVDLNIYINIVYFQEVISNINSEYFKWEYYNNSDSTLITETDNFDFKYVLMPLHM